MNIPILEVKNLSFEYEDSTSKRKVLDGINISINKGDFVGIIGRAGSGKSTFVQQLNGLLKPVQGKVMFKGNNILNDEKICFKIGLVFQYPEKQLFEETVFEDIAFGPKNKGLKAKEIEYKVYEAAKFVGLTKEDLYKSPFEISDGQKRRVAIAGIIAMDPEILILDEPTVGLDPKSRNDLLLNIFKYMKNNNKTVLIISHNMDDIANFTNKVIAFNEGKVVMFDKTKKVLSNKNLLKNIGMKTPVILEVMTGLKEKGYNLKNDIITINNAVKSIEKLINS